MNTVLIDDQIGIGAAAMLGHESRLAIHPVVATSYDLAASFLDQVLERTFDQWFQQRFQQRSSTRRRP
jgi:hypothetical protein